MILSRNWLNEFVDLKDITDKEFNDEMTLSGSKVETIERPDENLKNVVVGKILEMKRHENSDHMWVCQIDVGQAEPVQIVTGAWNIHVGDYVPAALHGAHLPGGVKIEKGKLRGVESNGMLCSLKELGMTAEHDFPYAVITPAALLNDYHPIDPAKPSIPADIKPGDKVYGPVLCGRVEAVESVDGGYNVRVNDGTVTRAAKTVCSNLHEGDLVAYNTKSDTICTLEDLHAEQKEFPHCIADGIFVLQEEDAEPGLNMAHILGFDDSIVEFEITPNRPDCLSVIGLAREASATFKRPLKLHTPEPHGCGGSIADLVDIDIEDGDLCPRYTARMVKNVKIAPSPRWMRERLRNSGVRPINNIVDITNYVMLEYGQPMHAFDFSCVEGGHIIVRTAREGETIQTLDGNERKLTPNMLCICDEHKPVCVAGVMGGANSEIVGDTAMVLFESANFNGVSVRRTASALGMRTDASSRYEKGLDMMNTIKAVERACELVELLGCGEVVDGVMDVVAKEKAPTVVKLEPDKINALLGTELSEDLMREILVSLGFILNGDDIYVPSWRGDVEHYSDIAEEVARFYGYNKIPCTLMRGETTRGGFSEQQRFDRAIGGAVRALGYDEIITYSFISPTYYDKIRMPKDSPLRNSLKILNPLGEDTSIMRTTGLPSMLDTLARNYNNRNPEAWLYEISSEYLPREGEDLPEEKAVLMVGCYGGEADFFTLKGTVESLLSRLNLPRADYTAVSTHPSYHPGRYAVLTVGDVEIGSVGEVHPTVLENFGIGCRAWIARLDIARMFAARLPEATYHALPRFPASTRDLAVICDESLPVAAIEKTITGAVGNILEQIKLFDVYRGAPVPAGKKSVAYSLVLRAADRTLTVEECDKAIEKALKALSQYGITLRA